MYIFIGKSIHIDNDKEILSILLSNKRELIHNNNYETSE